MLLWRRSRARVQRRGARSRPGPNLVSLASLSRCRPDRRTTALLRRSRRSSGDDDREEDDQEGQVDHAGPLDDAPDRSQQGFRASVHWHLHDRSIGHTYIKPPHPDLRQNRTLTPHRRGGVLRLLDGVVIDDPQVFNQRLEEWERFCN
jgi:hypothetical protein